LPFNYTIKHLFLHLSIIVLLSNVVSFYRSDDGLGMGVAVSVILAAPENAVAINTIGVPGSVDISWDKSPSADYGQVASYEVYMKLKTAPAYPLVPALTKAHTGAGSYSDTITGVSTTSGSDFIVYAVSSTGVKSSFDCASCKATNQTCPNALKEPGEACDGIDLGGQLCTDFGYVGGTLSCSLTCTLVYTACTSGGGSGGGGTPVDTTPPTSGTATVPQYANSKPVTITYTGATDTGGSGLSHVELWYKKGTSGWIASGLTSGGTSGSFSFSGFTTDDTYYFDLVAHDNQGNQSSPASGDGDGSTKYDTTLPIAGTATAPATAGTSPITVSYSGASDSGVSGFKQVELWYKKGSTGAWTSTGFTKTTSSGSFDFTTITGDDTYYFDLVAEDNAGNRSADASGSGDANTVYSVPRPTVILSGLPANPTYLSTTNITVGGTGVTAYKYKLDGGSYGAETLVATKIALSGLTAGTHTLYVIGKNSAGNWQLETNATQFTWTVDFTVPTITISNPSVSLSTGGNVTYTVTYTNASTITLSTSDVTLNKTGSANGTLAVTTAGESARSITISNITGSGTMSISITANTAQRTNGTSAAAAGPSNPFNVNVYAPACGNDILDTGEACDDGNLFNGDGCSSTCTIENLCGNGTINGSEACDDGNTVSNDGCSSTCTIENLCGNGTLNAGEACDDGNAVNGDGCSSICAIENLCGNNVLNAGEECDDGNLINGDGCSSICAAEVDHCANGIKDADEMDIDCGGADCALCHLVAPEHCTDEIKNEDEVGIDCGGLECNQCITVDFMAYAKPQWRTTSAGFGVTTNIELNRRSISKITNVKPVLFNSVGIADFEITDILPSNYDAGIKGMGYLRTVLYNIPLMDDATVRTLDFTFDDTYELIGGDVWSDNIINAGDVAQIIKTYSTANVSVDMNRDGVVNAADMAIVLMNYFKVGDNYF